MITAYNTNGNKNKEPIKFLLPFLHTCFQIQLTDHSGSLTNTNICAQAVSGSITKTGFNIINYSVNLNENCNYSDTYMYFASGN